MKGPYFIFIFFVHQGVWKMDLCDGSWRPQTVPQSTGVSEKLLDRLVPDFQRSDCDFAMGRSLLVSLVIMLFQYVKQTYVFNAIQY